jgi:hemerythrin-like domain-containing protein
MKALESLRTEHQVISDVLAALETYGVRLERDASMSPSDLRRFTTFLNEFAGIWHHGKEEELLMPTLVQHGLAWDGPPLQEIREDHEQENYLLRAMQQAALQEGGWSAEDRRHAVGSIRALVDFERKHMNKEETFLYPAAERILPAHVLQSLEDRCQRYERACFGRTSYADLRAVAQSLVDRVKELHTVQTQGGQTTT